MKFKAPTYSYVCGFTAQLNVFHLIGSPKELFSHDGVHMKYLLKMPHYLTFTVWH